MQILSVRSMVRITGRPMFATKGNVDEAYLRFHCAGDRQKGGDYEMTFEIDLQTGEIFGRDKRVILENADCEFRILPRDSDRVELGVVILLDDGTRVERQLVDGTGEHLAFEAKFADGRQVME